MNFPPPNNQVSFIITIKGEKVLSQHSISIHVEDEEKDTHHEVVLNAMLHKMIDTAGCKELFSLLLFASLLLFETQFKISIFLFVTGGGGYI